MKPKKSLWESFYKHGIRNLVVFIILSLFIILVTGHSIKKQKEIPAQDPHFEQLEIDSIQQGDFLMLSDSTVVLGTDNKGKNLYVINKHNDMYDINPERVIKVVKKDSIEQWAEYAKKFLGVE